MKTLIVVPSFNRPYQFKSEVGRWIVRIVKYDWVVIVEPKQLIYYSQVVPEKHLIVSEDDCGITGQMFHAKQYAERNGYDLIFKCDDEFKFQNDNWKMKDSDRALVEMLDDMIPEFENSLLGVICIAHYFTYRYNHSKVRFTHKNREVYGNYLVRTHLVEYPKGTKIFDDVVVGMNCILKGYYTLVYGKGYFGYKEYKNKGGIDLSKRNELSKHNCSIIQKNYPLVIGFTNKKGMFDLDCSAYYQKETIS